MYLDSFLGFLLEEMDKFQNEMVISTEISNTF